MSHMSPSLRDPRRADVASFSPVAPSSAPIRPQLAEWSPEAERGAALRENVGEAFMIGLALAQAAGLAAIILSAFGWPLVG